MSSLSRQAPDTPVDATPVLSPDSAPLTETIRLLNARGTVRQFKPDAIPEAWIKSLIAAGQRAPTSSNLQAYSIIMVTDPAIKAELAKLADNQAHICECPVFFALCADLTRIEFACKLHDTEFPGWTLEAGLVGSLDAALVGMSMSLVADSMGLGSVMIGAMRNKPLEVAKLLRLPKKAYVVFGLCVGWPKKAPSPKPRQSMDTVVHRDTYQQRDLSSEIAAYDQVLEQYYVERGADTPQRAWTKPVADKYSTVRRRYLRRELKELGFDLE